jgi:hypothetical protein
MVKLKKDKDGVKSMKRRFILILSLLLIFSVGIISAEKMWNFNNHSLNVSHDIYVNGGDIIGVGGGYIDIGEENSQGFTFSHSGGSYPDFYCKGSSGTNTYCEYRSGLFVSSGLTIAGGEIYARGGIQDDGGNLELNDDVDVSGYLNATVDVCTTSGACLSDSLTSSDLNGYIEWVDLWGQVYNETEVNNLLNQKASWTTLWAQVYNETEVQAINTSMRNYVNYVNTTGAAYTNTRDTYFNTTIAAYVNSENSRYNTSIASYVNTRSLSHFNDDILWTAGFNSTGDTRWLGSSDLDGYVPYTGASQNLVLGANNFSVDTSVLFVDSVSNTVSIGGTTTSTTYELYVTGEAYATSYIYAGGNLISAGDIYTTGAGDDLWLGTSTQASSLMKLYANGTLIAGSDVCIPGGNCLSNAAVGNLGDYLPLAGGTMGSGANINWVDTGTYISGTATSMTIESDDTLAVNADTSITVTAPYLTMATSGSDIRWVDAGTYIDGTATTLNLESDDYLNIFADIDVDIDAPTIDLSTQTVDVTLNNAVDSLNFDSNTLSIDALNNRVGIGDTTPGEELDVTGDINATGDICITGGNCLSSAGGGTQTLSQVLTAGNDAGNLEMINVNGIRFGAASSPGTWQIYASGTAYIADYLRADGGLTTDSTDPGTGNIRAGGNLTVNGGHFTVANAGDTSFQVSGNAGSGSSLIKMGDIDGMDNERLVTIDQANGYAYFEYLDVGIGDALDAPSYDLDVVGNIGATNSIFLGSGLYHEGDTDTYLLYDTDRIRFYAGVEQLLDLYEGTQDYVKLGDGGDVDINLNDDVFVEGSSGNVGIGTTSPFSKLDVRSGNISLATGGSINAYYSTQITARPILGTDQYTPGTDFTWIQSADTGSGDGVQIRNANGGAISTFLHSGNVGIGTTSPSATLDIVPSSGVALELGRIGGSPSIKSSDTSGYLIMDSNGTAAAINWYVSDNIVLANGGGNVGIGSSTNPISLFEVQGGFTSVGAVVSLSTKETSVVDTHVLGRINFSAPLESSGSDSRLAGASIWAEADGTFTSSANPTELVFGTATTSNAIERMRIASNGYVGIGTTTPGYWLDVNGDGRFISSVTASAFYYSSDERLKENAIVINDSLERIRQLEGINFNWKETGEPAMGLIAQDVEKVFPEIVSVDNETGMKTVAYGNLVAPLIESTKTLADQNDRQDEELENLKKELELLKKEIAKLKNSS